MPLHTLRADVDFGARHRAHALRHLRRQGLGVPGRDHGARPDGLRQAAGREWAVACATVMAGVTGHDAAEEDQVPQGLQGPDPGPRQGWHRSQFRRLRHEGGGAGPDHRAPDRGGAACDHPPPQARRPGLDPDLPGRAGVEEAGRGAHGQGQGLGRVLGRAASSRAGSCSRSTASAEDLASRGDPPRRRQAAAATPAS